MRVVDYYRDVRIGRETMDNPRRLVPSVSSIVQSDAFVAFRRVASIGLLALIAHGCSSSTGPNSKNNGTLVIAVKATGGEQPLIVVTGPGGDTAVITRVDTTLSVPAGTYTVTRADAVISGPVTTTFYSGIVKGSPANVATGATSAISITFALRPGSGRLWVIGGPTGATVAASYTGAELAAKVPGVSLSVAARYAAFDTAGNLWVADSAANTIIGYSVAQLGASGVATPNVTLTSNALQGPVGLAFDHAGTMWVSNFNSNTVIGFFVNQQRAGGLQKPAIVLSGIAFDGPARMSFDTAGNLWVPNTLTNTVVAIASSSLAVTGTPLPAITLTSADSSIIGSGGVPLSSISGPSGVAFDGSGDLWVANSTNSTLSAFNPSQLAASGPPVPFEALVLPDSMGVPTTVAFDNTGDLWTTSTAGAVILGYTGVQLAVGDTVPPAAIVPFAGPPSTLAFNPAGPTLPIAGGAFSRVRRTR